MKLFFLFLSFFLIQPKAKLENTFFKNKDIIEFSLDHTFNRGERGECNVYIGGTAAVKKVNGMLPKKDENFELYVKYPTKIRLLKGHSYKFTVEKFVPDSCTTPVDSVTNTRRFRLIEQVKI